MEMVELADGARIATWTQGSGSDAPAVFLLHGGPGLWDYLAPVADVVDDLAVVHRYDQRGCGRSSASADHGVGRYVDDLDELRRHFGHERITVVGHSAGATLALAYGATHPEHTAAVAYVCGTGIGDWRTPSHARIAELRAPFAERFFELDAKGERGAQDEAAWRTFQWATDYADLDVGLREARRMAEEPYFINYYANREVRASDDELVAWRRALTCPFTLVHGSLDPRPAANAVMLADAAPGSRKRIVQGASHMPWVDAPDEFAEVIREVVASAR